jgi:hypothetical protein
MNEIVITYEDGSEDRTAVVDDSRLEIQHANSSDASGRRKRISTQFVEYVDSGRTIVRKRVVSVVLVPSEDAAA